MVKTVKDFPFSIAQKISEEDSIVWLKESNKYIVLDSTMLELIKKKDHLSLDDFITLITESLQVSSNVAIRINKDISELLTETKKVQLKTSTKHPDIVKPCDIIQYYSFNDIIIKVGFDTEETKSLIHQKYSHLLMNHGNIYNVEYKIFNSDNTLFILKNNQLASDNGMDNVLIMIDEEGDLAGEDKDQRLISIDNHKLWIDTAAEMNCSSVRLNLYGSKDIETWKALSIESLTKLGEHAKGTGLNVIVENHGRITSNIPELMNAINGVNMDNVGTLPDFGNFCMADEGYGSVFLFYTIGNQLVFIKCLSVKFQIITGLPHKV